MKTLSIITVTYRDVAGLQRTLASLRAIPKDFSWEWVISDSSPELTAPLQADLAQFPVKYGSAPPKGIYSAMNEALGRAEGKYFWFLNGGDELAQFSVLRDALAQAEKDQALFCFCAVGIMEDGKKVRTLPAPRNPWRQFWGINRICHQGVLCHRETFQAGGFETQWKITADYLHFLKWQPKSPKVSVFTGELANFHRGGTSDRLWPALKEFGYLHLSNGAQVGYFSRLFHLLIWGWFCGFLGLKRFFLHLPGGNRIKVLYNALRQ